MLLKKTKFWFRGNIVWKTNTFVDKGTSSSAIKLFKQVKQLFIVITKK